jgi:hypothetical protein
MMFNRATRVIVCAALLMCTGSLHALGKEGGEAKKQPAAVNNENTGKAEWSELKKQVSEGDEALKAEREAIFKKSLRWSLLAAVPVNTLVVSALVWDWGKTRPFRFGKEGWFEHDTYEGGADKMAHMFAHYLLMRALYNIYNYTENGGPLKWAYSAGITGAIALGIEIGDGFCRNQNGFAYQDLTMGLAGIGIAALLEQFPAVDSFVSLSVEYIPTKYFREHPQRLKWFLDDYSGWKFMANIKLAGFCYVGLPVPEFIRYIQFDVGYYATGYTKYDYRWAEMERAFNRKGKERNVFIGISLNIVEIIKDFFPDKDNLACRAVQQPFKYYHVPAGYKQRFRL